MKRLILLIILISGLLYLFVARDVTENIEEIDNPTTNSPSTVTDNSENTPTYVSPISIEYLQSRQYDSDAPQIEQQLNPSSNYERYLASYESDGNTIYGLLTVPQADEPDGGFSAIIFNHGYIPPSTYSTTERYESYVDYLARNGFVVFKIDLRGHGQSEGIATGTYFSNGYTIDVINALKSLQKLDYVNPDKIGLWGHSMAGNLILRSMLVENDFKAGAIWAGAVYSYEDFSEYGLNDSSYRGHRDDDDDPRRDDPGREKSEEIEKLRDDEANVDFESEFWQSISLTQNLNFLNEPIQVHHAINDPVVDINYSRDLQDIMEANNKDFELYQYQGGGHNINSPYFETAMQRTVEFFQENLSE